MSIYYNTRTNSDEGIDEICSRVSDSQVVACTIERVAFEHRFSDCLSAIKLFLYLDSDPNKTFNFMIVGKENYVGLFKDLNIMHYYEATKRCVDAVIDSIGRILAISPFHSIDYWKYVL